jgi:hypothetical protein
MSLDCSCMPLWWMYSIDCDYVSLVSSRVLLGVVMYHWIVFVYYYGWTQLCFIEWHCFDCHGDYH